MKNGQWALNYNLHKCSINSYTITNSSHFCLTKVTPVSNILRVNTTINKKCDYISAKRKSHNNLYNLNYILLIISV